MNYELRKKEESSRASAADARPSLPSSTTRSGGFALLFAILASSVLLSIALAIWDIALREVVLSSFGRESQIAFFAADSGMECALYWDFQYQNNGLATSPFMDPEKYQNNPAITCAGKTIASPWSYWNAGPLQPSGFATSTQFTVTLGTQCVDVLVVKTNTGSAVTDVYSYGHNTCDSTSPTYVERGLKTSY